MIYLSIVTTILLILTLVNFLMLYKGFEFLNIFYSFDNPRAKIEANKHFKKLKKSRKIGATINLKK